MQNMVLKGLVCASVLLGMTGRAAADNGDFLGGLVGGMIGAAIVQGANNQPQQRSSQPQRTGTRAASPERTANIEVQTALNHFAFPVGNPDGVIGPRSRAAISEYQALLAFPVTGRLTEMERQILLSAHQRSLMGGPEVIKIVTSDPLGQRGLLVAQRNLLLGAGTTQVAGNGYGGLPPVIAAAVDEVARNSGLEPLQLVQRAGFIQLADMNADGRSDYLLDTSVTGSGFWCTGDACAVRVFVSTPDGFQRNDFQVVDPTPASFQCIGSACRLDETVMASAVAAAPAPAPVPTPEPQAEGDGTVMVGAAPVPALPSFAAAIEVPEVTYADHCQAVSQAVTQRGGVLQAAAVLEQPAQALGEQFCRVSEAAREDGSALMAQVQGYSAAQITEQCRSFAAALEAQMALVENEGRDNALSAVQGWLANAGMPNDQLTSTARICLSVGYAENAARMALGSALVLAGTGNMIYAELVGHHLVAGVGIAPNPERALEWFAGADAAVQAGQTPVFLAQEPDRMQWVNRAAAAVAGRAAAPPLLPLAPATVPASAASSP